MPDLMSKQVSVRSLIGIDRSYTLLQQNYHPTPGGPFVHRIKSNRVIPKRSSAETWDLLLPGSREKGQNMEQQQFPRFGDFTN